MFGWPAKPSQDGFGVERIIRTRLQTLVHGLHEDGLLRVDMVFKRKSQYALCRWPVSPAEYL